MVMSEKEEKIMNLEKFYKTSLIDYAKIESDFLQSALEEIDKIVEIIEGISKVLKKHHGKTHQTTVHEALSYVLAFEWAKYLVLLERKEGRDIAEALNTVMKNLLFMKVDVLRRTLKRELEEKGEMEWRWYI